MSIVVKAILGLELKYIVIDAITLGEALVVFVPSWIVVYKRRNLVKKINEQTIPYILTSLIIANQSIGLSYYNERNFFVNNWSFFDFEEGFSVQLSLLYLCLLIILLVQSVVIFTQIIYRRKPITTIFLPQSYKSIVVVALLNVVLVGLLFIVKVIIGNQEGKILDAIYLSCSLIIYCFIVSLRFLLNRFKLAKNALKQSLFVIVAQTSMLWIILLFLSLDFVGTVLQYIVLGILNMIAIVWFYQCSKVKPDVLDVFE
jgi:hypothetical protein